MILEDNMDKKRCIFHIPNKLDKNGKSGSQVRPRKMIEAFENIGYNVDVIMGCGEERKEAINKIKNNISSGVKYDFLYSESSTMPTLLTQENHIPKYPFLDFGFFKFCKKNNIPIGLFYRDIYWKFDIYKEDVSLPKRIVSVPFYKYDLKKYNELLHILYTPSDIFAGYLSEVNVNKTDLPPGCPEIKEELIRKREDYFNQSLLKDELRIFYVGGVSKKLYDLTLLLKVIQNKKNVFLTICCREEEWQKEKVNYDEYLTQNVKVIHEAGEKMSEEYFKCDICNAFLGVQEYRKIAMPIKVLEYLGYVTPIIAAKGTASGSFVEKNQIGFVIDYNEKELDTLLNDILHDKIRLKQIHNQALKAIKENTWEARAKKVANDLTKIKK